MKTPHVFLALAIASLGACGNPDPARHPAVDTRPQPSAEAAPAAPTNTPFDKSASYDTIGFRVTSPGKPTANAFTITPSGLSVSNDPLTRDIGARQVTDVLVDDMDADNSPEAVVTTRSADGKAQAYVFSTFGRRSFGMVDYPEVSEARLLAGYQGGDEYDMIENTFVRRFPLYVNGQRSSRYRQLQYKLKPGEARKQLVFDRSSEY